MHHFHFFRKLFGRCGVALLALSLTSTIANACCGTKTVAAVSTASCACAQTTVMAVPAVRMVLVPVTVMRAYYVAATPTCACAPAVIQQPTLAPQVQPAQPNLPPVPPPQDAPMAPRAVPGPSQSSTTTTTTTTTTTNAASSEQYALADAQGAEAVGVMGIARKLTLRERWAAYREAKAQIRNEVVIEPAQVVQTTEMVAVRARRGCRL
jgi:hypothetical protein